MKKILLIAILMIASLNFIKAQDQDIHFGAKVGINFAGITGLYYDPNASVSSGFRIGFNLGGIVNIPLNESFSVQPELLFTTGGVKNESTGESSFSTYTSSWDNVDNISLSYIQIPVVAKYKLQNGLFFEAGPYLGILLSGNDSYSYSSTVGGVNTASSGSQSVDSAMNKVDIGIALGTGYQLDGGFGFDFRYSIGFSNINKGYTDPSGLLSIPANGKNYVISISFHYLFGMKS